MFLTAVTHMEDRDTALMGLPADPLYSEVRLLVCTPIATVREDTDGILLEVTPEINQHDRSCDRWFQDGRFRNSQPNDDTYSDQDCVELRRSYYVQTSPSTPHLTDSFMWNDMDCDTPNYFVCETRRPGVLDSAGRIVLDSAVRIVSDNLMRIVLDSARRVVFDSVVRIVSANTVSIVSDNPVRIELDSARRI
ncbi:unnamed protein product, partial [Timema podura]|nr:unnamed protein product [Timema podura]